MLLYKFCQFLWNCHQQPPVDFRLVNARKVLMVCYWRVKRSSEWESSVLLSQNTLCVRCVKGGSLQLGPPILRNRQGTSYGKLVDKFVQATTTVGAHKWPLITRHPWASLANNIIVLEKSTKKCGNGSIGILWWCASLGRAESPTYVFLALPQATLQSVIVPPLGRILILCSCTSFGGTESATCVLQAMVQSTTVPPIEGS
jgi:hypothetical protein